MALSIQHIYEKQYRGFVIACHIQQGPHDLEKVCYTPMWKSTLNTDWHICNGWEYSLEAAEKLAQDCIDYNYLVERKEIELGRKLEIEELRPTNEM